jgi:hypothetical protein
MTTTCGACTKAPKPNFFPSMEGAPSVHMKPNFVFQSSPFFEKNSSISWYTSAAFVVANSGSQNKNSSLMHVSVAYLTKAKS